MNGIDGKPWPKPLPCKVVCVHGGVFVGTSWPGQRWYSSDGLEWTKGKPLTPNGINQVIYGEIPAAPK